MKYRRTLFDRFGAEAADYYNAARGAIISGALAAFAGSMYGSSRGWHPLVGILVGGLAGSSVSWLAIMGVSRLAGKTFSAFIQPQGTYDETFSYEESLLARGHYAEAIAAFEQHAAAGTGGAAVIIRAADLHTKHGDLKRAAELFRQAQRRPDLSAESHMYATNRLIDLYMGPLSNPDAAVSELRRLIATHPSSDAAKHARSALVSLKRQLRSEEAG